jgi:hypothetical protein
MGCQCNQHHFCSWKWCSAPGIVAKSHSANCFGLYWLQKKKKKKKTSLIARHSQIYPNWDFWFENIPSGNSATYTYVCMCVYIFSRLWACWVHQFAGHAHMYVHTCTYMKASTKRLPAYLKLLANTFKWSRARTKWPVSRTWKLQVGPCDFRPAVYLSMWWFLYRRLVHWKFWFYIWTLWNCIQICDYVSQGFSIAICI